MRPSSITIKSIEGKLYKITDLIKGVKEPLTDRDLKQYDMYPQSGIFKDLDGKLVDLADILTSSSKIQIDDALPENPTSNSLYIDKTSKSIAVFDEEIGEWIKLGNGEGGDSLTPDNALTEDEVAQVVSIFKSLKIK